MSNYCLVLLSLTISSAYSAVLDLPYAEGGSDADPNTWNSPGFIRHFIPRAVTEKQHLVPSIVKARAWASRSNPCKVWKIKDTAGKGHCSCRRS